MLGAELDKVIKRHQLKVVRAFDYNENKTGSCWYDGIAFWINKALDKRTINLDQLKLKKTGARVTHPDVRSSVCDFLESDDCIMKEYWIEELFGGNKER